MDDGKDQGTGPPVPLTRSGRQDNRPAWMATWRHGGNGSSGGGGTGGPKRAPAAGAPPVATGGGGWSSGNGDGGGDSPLHIMAIWDHIMATVMCTHYFHRTFGLNNGRLELQCWLYRRTCMSAVFTSHSSGTGGGWGGGRGGGWLARRRGGRIRCSGDHRRIRAEHGSIHRWRRGRGRPGYWPVHCHREVNHYFRLRKLPLLLLRVAVSPASPSSLNII